MSVKWLFNKCCGFERDLSLLAADALEPERMSEVRAHTEGCAACQVKYAEYRKLATSLSRQGSELPEIEPSAKLRQRWTSAVRRESTEKQPSGWLDWISGRKLAWGGIGAIWALILLFRISAPEAPHPAVVAAAPASLRDVLLALKVEPRESHSEPKTSASEVLRPQSQKQLQTRNS